MFKIVNVVGRQIPFQILFLNQAVGFRQEVQVCSISFDWRFTSDCNAKKGVYSFSPIDNSSRNPEKFQRMVIG